MSYVRNCESFLFNFHLFSFQLHTELGKENTYYHLIIIRAATVRRSESSRTSFSIERKLSALTS